MIEQAIAFSKNIWQYGHNNSDILIHCHSGISRSSAMAIAIYTALTQDPQDAVAKVSEQRPQSVPNIQVIRFADELLKMPAQMIDAVWEIFYPCLSDLVDL